MLQGALIVLALTVLAQALARFPGFSVVGPLGTALLVAALWRAGAGLPQTAEPGVRFFARPLLRFGIVLMGVRLDFGRLAEAGPRVLAVDVLVVALGALAIVALGRSLAVRKSLALLLGVGTAVCGASAIAAIGPLARADEEDVAVSIGLISLVGTIGVLTYPALARVFGLSDAAYGLVCGATLQEVPQVLAASFARTQETGDFGTLVKLTRVALLAPLALVLAGLERAPGAKPSWRTLPIPGFLLGFLALGVARSVGLVPEALVPWIENASKLVLAAAMAAVGLGVHGGAIRRLGVAPIVLAVVGWLVVIAIALASAGPLGLLR
jgi:uncharacterized integral membrane protein (TIGR00698 family)